MRETLEVSNTVAAELAGISDGVLDALENRLECTVRLRGNELTLEGEEQQISEARAVIDELVELVEGGHQIGAHTVDAVLGTLEAGARRARRVRRGRLAAPRQEDRAEDRHAEGIRRLGPARTVTFGIGPAGTGKTYLAMACAVAALHEREVARIILTRPAVEAGERLGFLPGDLMAKVDPYLRPLFDALYDMLDPDKALNLIDRGTIEVAPLAFMRGRAQPVESGVSTPEGFRPIGSLRVGDLVTGSDGRPTVCRRGLSAGSEAGVPIPHAGRRVDAVLRRASLARLHAGGPPQRQARPRARDTADDRASPSGAPAPVRVPLLSGPACLEAQDVPIDPYALGLLLGDGCLTTKTTPSFRTRTRSSRTPSSPRSPGSSCVRRAPTTTTCGTSMANRGGVIVANPVTAALRTWIGGNSLAHEVHPDRSTSGTRWRSGIAVLQGLLDSDGGPVTQRGRTCRIQYTTCSERLRDDVLDLVRSLGGIAYWRRRAAEGRAPGGRPAARCITATTRS